VNAVLIQPDQLSATSALIKKASGEKALVVLIEDTSVLTELPFHKQRLIFLLAAMRSFAEELRQRGYRVSHHRLCGDPVAALTKTFAQHGITRVTLMRAASHGVDERCKGYIERAGAAVDFVENDMFISARYACGTAPKREKRSRMEPFYRAMRLATGILMDAGAPVGGQWNYDAANRKPPAADMEFPPALQFEPDAITREAIADVQKHFAGHYGCATPFGWPVTRGQAQELLDDFVRTRLEHFGTFQDAMVDGEDAMFHSLLSACLNVGLLDPEAVCRTAESAYRSGAAPLNSVEGFIRQILGWREYVYQFYRANMPDYDRKNYFDADLPLPKFYWDGQTRMRCVSESVRPVLQRGLSHHIQRLMVTGNFALLAGVNPDEVNRWYWLGFVDAWHWVVTPNVIGMALFADGGLMASKPYAASANYINRMSDYCAKCPYNPRATLGAIACPFNALYWDFLERNRERLQQNPRLSLSYKNLDRKTSQERGAIRDRARALQTALRSGEAL